MVGKLVGLTFGVVLLAGCSPGNEVELPEVLDEVVGEKVELSATGFADEAGLAGMTGEAVVDIFGGEARVEVSLPEGVSLPSATALEAWLVDSAAASSATEADERFGPAFGDESVSAALERLPYGRSLGVLTEKEGKWTVGSDFAGEYTPYDEVVVTLESDGSVEDYDPRPATPVLTGRITGEPFEELE